MMASQDSSKVQELLAKGLTSGSAASNPTERARKLKLRLIVASVVAFCTVLTLVGGVISLVSH